METTTRDRLAVIGSADMAFTAEQSGIRLVGSGDSFVDTANAIQTEATSQPGLPVLVAGTGHDVRLIKFLNKAKAACHILVTDPDLADDGIELVDTPAPLEKVFSRLNMPAPDQVRDLVLNTNGTITEVIPPQAPEIAASWLDEDDDQESAPHIPSTDPQLTTPTPGRSKGEERPDLESMGLPPLPDASSQRAQPAPSPETQPRLDPTPEIASPASTSPNLSNLFGQAPPAARPQTGRRTYAQGKVIVVAGAKGGVGKTTTSIELAQRASEAGLNTLLVDASRGQGDIRTYLRLRKAQVPTVFDVSFPGARMSEAVLTPEVINEVRQVEVPHADRVGFHVALAPVEKEADPNIVTAGVYSKLVDWARGIFDVVIVDTQIYEAHDTTTLWDSFIKPILAMHYGWSVAVTEPRIASSQNTFDRFLEIEHVSGNKDRVFGVVNKIGTDPASQDKATRIAFALQEIGREVFMVPAVPGFADQMDEGFTPDGEPHISDVAGRILTQVTGTDATNPVATAALARPQDPTPKKVNWFARLFGWVR